MVFEVGKFYKHTTGQCFSILSEQETTMYGKTLIAEIGGGCQTVSFMAVGRDESSTANYHEISKDEWMKNFSKN